MHGSTRGKIAGVLAVLVLITAALTLGAGRGLAASPFGPSLASDQTDYLAGSTVTLSGSGWESGSAVHIHVSSTDPAFSWSTNGDVVAGGDGSISFQFMLPEEFAASYEAVATGSMGQTATATFTDAPTIFAFNQPLDGAQLSSGAFVIRGSAPAPAGAVGVSINGVAQAGVLGPAAGSWTLAVTLADGAYDITATQAGTSFTHHVLVDSTKPTINCASADGAWHGNNVGIHCTAADGGSGLRNPPADVDFQLVTGVNPGVTDANASTNSNLVCDVVGNCATAGPISGNKIDRQKPAIDCHGASSDALWHAGNVSFDCAVSDGAGSGVASPNASAGTSVPDGSETASAIATTGNVCDAVGNCGSADIAGNKIDRAAPAVNCTVPDKTVWYAGHLNVNCTATDGGSGIPTGDNAFFVQAATADGTDTTSAFTGSHAVTDGVGHSVPVGPFGPFMLDNNAPLSTIRCNGTACNGTHWYGLGTVISVVGDDGGGSGYAGSYYTLDGTDPGPGHGTFLASGHSFTIDATTTITWRTVDNVSNLGGSAASPPNQVVQVDGTPPAITLSTRTPANAAGWNNSDVRVVWSCADDLSGPRDLFVGQATGAEGAGQSLTGTCYDNAGNPASATVDRINIDKTAPTTRFDGKTPPANANGWNNTNVTFKWTCLDGLSGPVAPGDQVTLINVGVNRPATGNCTDLADNHSSDTQFASIDQTVPITTFVGRSPAPNLNGWNNVPVTLTWACADADSGPAAQRVTVTVSGDGAHQSATGVCFDKAGNSNSETRDSINIDRTPPVMIPRADITVAAVTAAGEVTGCDQQGQHEGNFQCPATLPSGTRVVWTGPAATDNLDPSPTVACAPASSTLFRIGDTLVTCKATDWAGNISAPTTFTVHVKGAPELMADIAARIAAYTGASAATQQQLRAAALAALNAFNLGMPSHKAQVCNGMNAFNTLVKTAGQSGKLPPATANDWIADGNRVRAVLAC